MYRQLLNAPQLYSWVRTIAVPVEREMSKDLLVCAVLFKFGLCARGEVWPVVNQPLGPIYPNHLNFMAGYLPPQQASNPYIDPNR